MVSPTPEGRQKGLDSEGCGSYPVFIVLHTVCMAPARWHGLGDTLLFFGDHSISYTNCHLIAGQCLGFTLGVKAERILTPS